MAEGFVAAVELTGVARFLPPSARRVFFPLLSIGAATDRLGASNSNHQATIQPLNFVAARG